MRSIIRLYYLHNNNYYTSIMKVFNYYCLTGLFKLEDIVIKVTQFGLLCKCIK